MNRLKLIFISLVLILAMMSISFATTNYRGDMVYRDGVLTSVVWHAGIVVGPYSSSGQMIVQASGYGSSVAKTTYDAFLPNGLFQGVYRNVQTTPYGRECVASMAETLTYYNIPYTAFQLMLRKASFQTSISPKDISYMRCDGVVEYCNDYYGYNFQYGDISTSEGYSGSQGGMPQDQAANLTRIAPGLK